MSSETPEPDRTGHEAANSAVDRNMILIPQNERRKTMYTIKTYIEDAGELILAKTDDYESAKSILFEHEVKDGAIFTYWIEEPDGKRKTWFDISFDDELPDELEWQEWLDDEMLSDTPNRTCTLAKKQTEKIRHAIATVSFTLHKDYDLYLYDLEDEEREKKLAEVEAARNFLAEEEIAPDAALKHAARSNNLEPDPVRFIDRAQHFQSVETDELPF